MNISILRSVFFVITVCCLLVSCGKRGIPEPPSLVVPKKIEDLRVVVSPGSRHLVWSLPTVNADNSKPVDLKGFKILLKKLPLDQDACRFCDEGFQEYLELILDKPTQGYVLGSVFYLPLPPVAYGYVDVFSVSAVNSRGWLSQTSNKLAVFALPEILPPTKLVCQPSASVVDLSWQPPALPAYFDGKLVYRVYRRKTVVGEQAWQLITPEPVSDPEFIDVGLVDWGSYEYCVTAIVYFEDTSLESIYSDSTIVIPGDYIAPAAVENFTAFYYQGGIQLLWDASPDSDLAGYRIYRHDSFTGLDLLFSTLPPTQHEYFDNNIDNGRSYTYRVTAFDQSDRKNESDSSFKITVTIP